MKHTLIVLFSLMLTAQLASCQDGLPRLIHYGGDTLILISVNQGVVANIVNAELVRHMQLKDSLSIDLQRHKTTIIRMEDAMVWLQKSNIRYKELDMNNQDIIEALQKELNKEAKRRKRAEIIAVIMGGLVVVVGVLAAAS